MRSIVQTCKPRPELLAPNFNPEMFTLSLSTVMDFYCGERTTNIGMTDKTHTDAELFFSLATFPTDGLKTTLHGVFARLAGDMTVPAMHRLETAFGGGKTHTLISCAHIAFRGAELAEVTKQILPADLLPQAGEIAVVGVAGDSIPVHETKGSELIPYTLWGEIAFQIGGSALYHEVETEARSYAAPGRTYFDRVLGGRKALIMLDELAQYAARLEAARADGGDQVAAFLMGLQGYARERAGIAIVVTLASTVDAFSRQTKSLAKSLSSVRGEDVSESDALTISERAVKGVGNVVARDAIQVTPVQAAEISSVLSKRLFEFVDSAAAIETAEEYVVLYNRNMSMLPEEATRTDFRDRMIATYPFHPTLVDFLNKKLATAENFQGTRGVLRVLALAVRDLWRRAPVVSMIHQCHLNLRSAHVINEILGRSGSSDLMFVLNADIGGVDTASLEGGISNAQAADRKNPHPDGYPMYQYVWQTVFLNSLVGRGEGLDSTVFGIGESDAMFAVSFPGLTPPQVRVALDEIGQSAFYLKQGVQNKYYADDKPTINSVLARIQRTVTANQINEVLQAAAQDLIRDDPVFSVQKNVAVPEDIPDVPGKIQLGVVSLVATEIDVDAMIITKGPNLARVHQNLVMLLVPETVEIRVAKRQQGLLEKETVTLAETRKRMEDTARQVRAWRMLTAHPENYSVSKDNLRDEEVRKRFAERENALKTIVSRAYSAFYYPSKDTYAHKAELRIAGGEGGTPFIQAIRDVLRSTKKLLTAENTRRDDLTGLSQLFFKDSDVVQVETLRQKFMQSRAWPVLENVTVLDQIIRAGVTANLWCVYHMGDDPGPKPKEFYDHDEELPMAVDLQAKGYGLVTPQGAKQRMWDARIDFEKAKEMVTNSVLEAGCVTVDSLKAEMVKVFEGITVDEQDEVFRHSIKSGKVLGFKAPEGDEKPEMITESVASFFVPGSHHSLISPQEVQKRGWGKAKAELVLDDTSAVETIMPLLKRLGSLYTRDKASTTIDALEISGLALPHGGTLKIEFSHLTPDSAKTIGEFLTALSGVVEKAPGTAAYLRITDWDKDCALIKELQESKDGAGSK